jgi:hypothetical protein
MSENQQSPILCGKCHVEVEQRVDDEGNNLAVCPSCGVSDTVDNAIRDAADYLTEKIARDALKPFERMRSTPTMKVTVTHAPEREHRFIVG